jgi:hypothetical protein
MFFEERPSHEVVKVDSDVRLEFDEKGKVIGIDLECWQTWFYKTGGKNHSRISIVHGCFWGLVLERESVHPCRVLV